MLYFTAAMSGYVPMIVAIPARPVKAAIAVLLVTALFTALHLLEDKEGASGRPGSR